MIAPWLAALATPTRFSAGFSRSAMLRNVRVPVTTTSAVRESPSTASAVTVCPAVTFNVRRTMVKLISLKVSSAGPAGTSVDAIVTGAVGYSGGLHPVAVQVDGHTWQNAARLIGDAAGDRAARLRVRKRREHQPSGSQNGQSLPSGPLGSGPAEQR